MKNFSSSEGRITKTKRAKKTRKTRNLKTKRAKKTRRTRRARKSQRNIAVRCVCAAAACSQLRIDSMAVVLQDSEGPNPKRKKVEEGGGYGYQMVRLSDFHHQSDSE